MKDYKLLKFIWSKLTMPAFVIFYIISFYVSSKDLAKVSVQYPHFLLAVLCVVMVLIIIKEIAGFVKENRAEESAVDEESTKTAEGSEAAEKQTFFAMLAAGARKWYKQIGYVVLSILYVIAIYYVGYYVSTVVFAAAMAYLLGVKKPLTIAAISVGVTVATYLMMTLWLNLSMPSGLLF